MSVNQHKAPKGAKPYLFVTVDNRDYAFPLASVAEVSRPAFGAGEAPSSVVLRGREMRLVNLPALFGSAESIQRIVRLTSADGHEAAVAVHSVPGTRWRLESTLFPISAGYHASNDTEAHHALGMLRLVGPEFPEQPAGQLAQESSR